MDEVTLQTIVSFLEKHNKIAIALSDNPTVDMASAALAFQAALLSIGKTVDVVTEGVVPSRLSFLPNSDKVHQLAITSSQLVVTVDTTRAELAELSYDTEPGKLRIYLRSKGGQFAPADVSAATGELPYEVIVMFGVASPEQLGKTFTDHTELFYTLPRINIDVSPHNDNHGTLNLVNVTTSSVSELAYHVLAALKGDKTLPVAATGLLAGILASTDSLRNQKTTPDTFAVVADLIAAGAEYALVVKHLFKTERLGFLKLWGRSLARLKVLDGQAAAYSVLLAADFEKTGELPDVAKNVLAELQENVTGMLTIVLAVPHEEGSRVVATYNTQVSFGALFSELQTEHPESFRLDNGLEVVTAISPIPPDKIEQQLVAGLSKALPMYK